VFLIILNEDCLIFIQVFTQVKNYSVTAITKYSSIFSQLVQLLDLVLEACEFAWVV